MIRQTLRGLRNMWSVFWPTVVLAAPPIAGFVLLPYVLWLGILSLSLTAVVLVLFAAYSLGGAEW